MHTGLPFGKAVWLQPAMAQWNGAERREAIEGVQQGEGSSAEKMGSGQIHGHLGGQAETGAGGWAGLPVEQVLGAEESVDG